MIGDINKGFESVQITKTKLDRYHVTEKSYKCCKLQTDRTSSGNNVCEKEKIDQNTNTQKHKNKYRDNELLNMLQDSLFSAFSNEKFFVETTMENYVGYNSSQSSFSFSSGLEYCGIGTKTNTSGNTAAIVSSVENANTNTINEYTSSRCGNTTLQYEKYLHCQRRGSLGGLVSSMGRIINTDSNNNTRQSKHTFFCF